MLPAQTRLLQMVHSSRTLRAALSALSRSNGAHNAPMRLRAAL